MTLACAARAEPLQPAAPQALSAVIAAKGFIPLLADWYGEWLDDSGFVTGELGIDVSFTARERQIVLMKVHSTLDNPGFEKGTMDRLFVWLSNQTVSAGDTSQVRIPLTFGFAGEVIRVYLTGFERDGSAQMSGREKEELEDLVDDLQEIYVEWSAFHREMAEGTLAFSAQTEKKGRVENLKVIFDGIGHDAFVARIIEAIAESRPRLHPACRYRFSLRFQDLRGPYEVFIRRDSGPHHRWNIIAPGGSSYSHPSMPAPPVRR